MLENYLKVNNPPAGNCFSCKCSLNQGPNVRVYAHTNGNSPDQLSCHAHEDCINYHRGFFNWSNSVFNCENCMQDIDKINTFVTREFVEIRRKNDETSYCGYVGIAVVVGLYVAAHFIP